MSETDISRNIRKALEKLGFWVIRLQSSGRRGSRSMATGEPGLPDLYLPGIGHLEIKVPGKDLSKTQVEWHAKAESFGVPVAVARGVSDAVKWALSLRSKKARNN